MAESLEVIRDWVNSVLGGVVIPEVAEVVEALHTLTVPLVWIALAAIVFASARPELVPVAAPTRPARWWQQVLAALPAPFNHAAEQVAEELRDRWEPIIALLRQVWRAGFVALAASILLWYVVQALTGWLTVGLMHALGPQPSALADAVANIGSALGDSLTAVLGLIAVVAALDALRERTEVEQVKGSSHSDSGTPVHGTVPAASTRASDTVPAGSTNPTTPAIGSP